MKWLVAAILILAASAIISSAEARQVYCYAEAARTGGKLERNLAAPTLYITPVFKSDESEDLLAANFGQSVPDAGLATCVTDEYQADLPAAWQDFVNDSKAQGETVVIEPSQRAE